MRRGLLLIALTASLTGPALAQAPMGDSAKSVLGDWEFSNADRDKICVVTFKADPAKIGYKVEFDKNCPQLFPLVSDVASWNFPENDFLLLLNAQGKALVQFSESERGYEAPTEGVGVLFLQKAGDAAPPPKPPSELAGNWAIMRGDGPVICTLALAATAAKDGFALTVNPGCDAAIAKLNFSQWQIDGDELMLMPARGAPWRFEEIEGGNWQRLPQTADQIRLMRQ